MARRGDHRHTQHCLGRLVSAVTGVVLVAVSLRFGATWELPAHLVFAGGLVVLSAIDARDLVLPDRIVVPLAGASMASLGSAAALEGNGAALVRALACGAGAFGVLLALHVVSPGGLGLGDVKLGFVIGLDLGWLGAEAAMLGLALAFVYGAVAGAALIVGAHRSRHDPLPFGPFLAAGALSAVFVG